MQTLYVPKYGIHYRVNPKNSCELQWSKKPFGPMTMWQHAMTFKQPIRALDIDDDTKQGVVVLNDSSTYVGSGVRVWGRKFYTAGSRMYSLYAIGESMVTEESIQKLIGQCYHSNFARNIVAKINKTFRNISADYGETRDGSYNIYVRGTEQDLYDALLSDEFDAIAQDINSLEKDYKPKKLPYTYDEIKQAANAYVADCMKDGLYCEPMQKAIRYGEYVTAAKWLAQAGYLKSIGESKMKSRMKITVHEENSNGMSDKLKKKVQGFIGYEYSSDRCVAFDFEPMHEHYIVFLYDGNGNLLDYVNFGDNYDSAKYLYDMTARDIKAGRKTSKTL